MKHDAREGRCTGHDFCNEHKEDNAKLESYFREVLPEFDEDRVYASDIKKILNWYNMLQVKGLVSKEEEDAAAESPAQEEVKTEE